MITKHIEILFKEEASTHQLRELKIYLDCADIVIDGNFDPLKISGVARSYNMFGFVKQPVLKALEHAGLKSNVEQITIS